MGVTITNVTLRNISTLALVSMAILTYIVGSYFYYSIKQLPVAARVVVTDTRWFGTLTRATHIILFLFIGYFIPDRFWLVMALGAGWEIVEYFARLHFRDPWWGTGTDYVKDTLANAAGYVIGTTLHARAA